MLLEREIHCGDRILELCDEFNINQVELSRRMKKPVSTVNGWITKSDIPLKNIRKICGALNIELWRFFVDKKEIARAYDIHPALLELCHKIQSIPNKNDQYNFILHIESGLHLVLKDNDPV